MQRFWWSVGTLHAVVRPQTARSIACQIREATVSRLAPSVRGAHSYRQGAEAVVRLNDGSTVEMDEAIRFADRERPGTTINLNRGKIIVQAAPQSRKFVATPDSPCL